MVEHLMMPCSGLHLRLHLESSASLAPGIPSHLRVSINQGPEHRPQHIVILIIDTPKEGPQIFETPIWSDPLVTWNLQTKN